MYSPRIVVMEDDDAIGEVLVDVLRLDGYDVERIGTEGSLDAVRARGVALVVIDLDSTPGVADVCRRVKAERPLLPVLALASGRDTATVVAESVAVRADDAVRKPFALAEVRARIRAHLRQDVVTPARIVAGDVEMDRVSRRVWQRGRELEMRPKEFDLLALLLEQAGSAVSRNRIMHEVWDASAARATKSLDVHISTLRRKLGDANATRIVTVRGVGYRYESVMARGSPGAGALATTSLREGARRPSRPTRA